MKKTFPCAIHFVETTRFGGRVGGAGGAVCYYAKRFHSPFVYSYGTVYFLCCLTAGVLLNKRIKTNRLKSNGGLSGVS